MSVLSSSGSSYFQAPPAPVPTPPQGQKTPAAVPLINGTQTILSLTTPNDSKTHTVRVGGALVVTTAETGGGVVIQWTQNGIGCQIQQTPGGSVAGSYPLTQILVCDPNTNVNILQNTALTAGAAFVNCSITAE